MNLALWYLARASGMVSIVLLTVTVVLGALTAGRGAPVSAPHFIRAALHRTLSLTMVIFVAVHVVTTVVETYVDIGWISAIVPFSSSYNPFWVGLGTLSLDLLIAVVLTSLLKQHIPHRAWRLVHWLSYALWPVALVHGLGASTKDTAVMLVITLGCLASGVTAILWRTTAAAAEARRRPTLTHSWR
ncbi:ferric reductase-like transmembrane domain-containing protein [Microlunatus panaciterrae]|uniref:Ferric reductase n=1 Tax=Microlunatus panaciterrae TaxID=400768 RepID=A0ABS2RGH4_9ACTN|nr:ferric reductase-like transmembrane domain-containing protein [Microlunatus panaciterrae]MBM7798103.1 putative ferric reductase [Microlunatus panaciterrae]